MAIINASNDRYGGPTQLVFKSCVSGAGGAVALVLYNKGEFPINITVDLSDIMAFNLTATNSSGAAPLFRARVENLFTDETSDVTFNITAVNVPPHGSSMYRVSALPSGWIPNTGKQKYGDSVLARCTVAAGIWKERGV